MPKLLSRSMIIAATFVSGAALADGAFTVTLDAPPAKKAQRGVVKIHIQPGPGFHVNKDYPTAMKIAPPAGVAVEKAQQGAKDATRLEEAGIDFEVAYTASESGKKAFAGDLKFAVCSASSCDPKREPLAFTVDVK